MKVLKLKTLNPYHIEEPSIFGVDVITGVTVSFKDVSWTLKRGGRTILHRMSFTVPPGHILGVVGPNGAGKSTLLRLIYRFLKPTSGVVTIDGMDIWKMTARAAACKVAAVLQEQPTDFALTVREIVALGRTPHRIGFAGSAGEYDEFIVETVLGRLDLEGFASRSLGTLSGGERQRVMVARALAQEPCVLVLDEPTNHLDIRHQLEVLELIRDLPLTIVTSLHDLNMASDVCNEVALLKEGHLVGFGLTDKVFSERSISNSFRVAAQYQQLTPSKKNILTYRIENEETS